MHERLHLLLYVNGALLLRHDELSITVHLREALLSLLWWQRINVFALLLRQVRVDEDCKWVNGYKKSSERLKHSRGFICCCVLVKGIGDAGGPICRMKTCCCGWKKGAGLTAPAQKKTLAQEKRSTKRTSWRLLLLYNTYRSLLLHRRGSHWWLHQNRLHV